MPEGVTITRRSWIWLTLATVFTGINAAGVVWAAAEGEPIHALVHVVGLALGGFWMSAVITRGRRHSRHAPQLDDNRLQQLEHSVDEIALQVERIGEAQRFSQKLVEEAFPPASDPTSR
jgi:hypothetical protein